MVHNFHPNCDINLPYKIFLHLADGPSDGSQQRNYIPWKDSLSLQEYIGVIKIYSQ